MRLMLSRRSFAKAILLSLGTMAPVHALAQSSEATQRLTTAIAEKALAPGTTKKAAAAWMRYWKLTTGAFLGASPREFGIKSVPDTASVLKGWVMYPDDAISATIIQVFIFLDAGDRVIATAAGEIGMIE
jgi:hypothetical protein